MPRPQPRARAPQLSEHGRADALDVRDFKLADGRALGLTDVNVDKDWRESIKASACARFSTVLGPGSDGYHEEHIHLDLAERRNNYKICQWDVREPPPPVGTRKDKTGRRRRPIAERARQTTAAPQGDDAARFRSRRCRCRGRGRSADAATPARDVENSRTIEHGRPQSRIRKGSPCRRQHSPLSNLAARDVETLVHPYINLARFRETGPLVIERGQGVYVYDTDGKPYIEGMAGLWCTALGYGNEELVEAAATQMRKLSFAHLFTGSSHDPAIELAEKLKEIAPVPISKVFFCNSGSEANDTQVKLVWYLNNALGRPKKKKIVSRIKAYHGVTMAAASLTGLPGNHRDFDLPLPGFLHTGCPHHYRFAQDGESEEEFATRLAAELDALIVKEGPDTVAAFIAEPVMGAGGVIVPPQSYFEKIMAVCAKHDVFMISDEVICGFGRLGTTFGCEKLNFAPHSLSIAKVLSSAYLPIAGVMIPETHVPGAARGEQKDRRVRPRLHLWRPSGLRRRRAQGDRDLSRATASSRKPPNVAPQFQARLKALGEHPLVGEARGLGLDRRRGTGRRQERPSASFDPQHGVGARAVQFAEAEGLIVRSVLGDVLTLSPPLVISAAGNRRIVRPADARARQDARLGDARAARAVVIARSDPARRRDEDAIHSVRRTCARDDAVRHRP